MSVRFLQLLRITTISNKHFKSKFKNFTLSGKYTFNFKYVVFHINRIMFQEYQDLPSFISNESQGIKVVILHHTISNGCCLC